MTASYLCLTLTLHTPKDNKRVLTLAPYNKRQLFNFVFPMLTKWKSEATRAVKLAALKSMMQYAIMGSNDPESTVQFICNLIDRLILNGYPRNTIMSMWKDVEASQLFTIPCRFHLHNHLYTVATRVTTHIDST